MVYVFDHDDFRKFLRDWLKEQPKRGRGILSSWSELFRIHPSLLSQILAEKRALGPELALQIAHQIPLSEVETDYFLLLAQYDQAGTASLRARLKKKIEEQKNRARQIAARVESHHEITNEQKNIYYSSWIYAAIRNKVALSEASNARSLADTLKLPLDEIESAIAFLVDCGLLQSVSGLLKVGSQKVFVSSDSIFAQRHHQNWRLQGFSRMFPLRQSDLFLTIPMSLSVKDAERIRKILPEWFEQVQKIVGPSKSEVNRCLSFDYFEF